jgi:hypothetical protein
MSFKIKTHTSESADTVFANRKKDVLDRIDYLRGLVDKFNPSTKDHDTISDLDYILDSLDDVIKDTKDATGLG